MSDKAKPYGGKIDMVLELAPHVVAIVDSLPKWDDITEPQGVA